MKPDWELAADRYAADSLADGSPTAWFERLYRDAADGAVPMPWDRRDPSGPLREWVDSGATPGRGRAVVVGCGLGADAEYLAAAGFDVTAFDVSSAAVEIAENRHPGSSVDYRQADLFALPSQWAGAFDLVVEIFTVQAMPEDVRATAIDAVRALVAPGGVLLVVTVVRQEAPIALADGPPWPLTPSQLRTFDLGAGSTTVEIATANWPGATLQRAEFRRP